MADNSIHNRCRLVLIAPDIKEDDQLINALREALEGGDVASLIIPQYERDDGAFLSVAKAINQLAHDKNVATMIVNNSQVMGRSGADGLHYMGNLQEIPQILEDHSDKHLFGAGGLLDRHRALNVGEYQPDYIMFGKIDGDIKEDAHPKNIALGEWWASIVEIPAIVMGGQSLDSVIEVAQSGVEFIALNIAIFNNKISPSEAVAKANTLLEAHSPILEDAD